MKEFQKRVLVVGTNGFIAKNLINYLKKKNIIVYSTTKNETKNNIFFDLKLNNEIKIKNLVKFDYLVHCSYQRCNSYNDELKINLSGSKKIFEYAKLNNTKIIYLSSESSSAISKSNYGKIKFLIEVLAKEYNAKILKPGLVYKDNSFEGIYGKINYFIKKFPIIFFPSGINKKIHLCNIDFLIKKIFLIIISNKNIILEDINSREDYSLRESCNKISKINNKKIIMVNINYKLMFYILKLLEIFRIKLNIKSDSLLSLLD